MIVMRSQSDIAQPPPGPDYPTDHLGMGPEGGSHVAGLVSLEPSPENRRGITGSVGRRALGHWQAQHEVGGIWRADRVASGLGPLSAHQ